MNVFVRTKKVIITYKNKLFISRLRKKYNSGDITIISNSCLGGVIYHQLGIKFCSPTINLWIEQKGFLDFCLDVFPYLNSELKEIDIGCEYPTGTVIPSNGLEPIIIHFNHYKTFEEACEKWNERKKRVLKDKIVVFYDASASTKLSEWFLSKWELITYPKLAFGCLNRQDVNDYCYIDFDGSIRPTKIMQRQKNGRLYLNQVDYVAFLNKTFNENKK